VVRKLAGKRLPLYVLSRKPPVVAAYFRDFINQQPEIAQVLPQDEQILTLFQLGWETENKERLAEIRQGMAVLSDSMPNLKIHFLCNSKIEREKLNSLGFEATFCHQNAFVDWNTYNLEPALPRKYDAIYVARITPFKRHYLAKEIRNLYLIGDYHDYESEFAQNTLRQVTHAKWRRKVTHSQIARHIQSAHTGLCLSSVEGAMFVSVEYLLCGVPVVSTRSIGGRDAFFDVECAVIVDDDPDAVSDAVRSLSSNRPDPRDIRQHCIDKMLPHRDTLVSIVQDFYDEFSVRRSFADEFPKVFTHKLALRCSPAPEVPLRRLPMTGKLL